VGGLWLGVARLFAGLLGFFVQIDIRLLTNLLWRCTTRENAKKRRNGPQNPTTAQLRQLLIKIRQRRNNF
jgi:hypothetical protein